jgi:hypothetical protein
VVPLQEPTPLKKSPKEDSATESESETAPKHKTLPASQTPSLRLRDSGQPSSANPSKDVSPALPSRSQTKAPASDSDSSPIRPTKKPKNYEESDEGDSEEERRRRAAAIKNGATAKRGTRQPLKRGGKRF